MNNNQIPVHVAIIPDGNRRWARKNGLPRFRGHEIGADRMSQTVEHLMKLGVRFVTVWGFSTDNWKRKDDEVFSLFKLLESWINKTTSWAQDNEARLKYIGRLQELPDNLQNAIKKAVIITENNQGLTLTLAFNYTGRIEIIDAVNKLIAEHPAIKLMKIPSVVICIQAIRRMSIWSSGQQANSEYLTSCYGRLLIVNSTLPLFCGRISTPKN